MNEIIKNIIRQNKEYKINVYARSIAFYLASAIAPITIVLIFILNKYQNVLSSFITIEVFQIIIETFSNLFLDQIEKVEFTGLSIFFSLSIVYSAAKIINGFNQFSAFLYKEKRHRNFIFGLISSGFVFLILLLLTLVEFTVIFFGTFIFTKIIKNYYLLKLIELIVELTLFFISISILYIYVPPKKMKLKKVYKGAVFSSLLMYIIFEIFIILFNVLYKNNQIVAITFVITMFYFFSFILFYILLYGLVINYNNKIFL